MCSRLQRCAEVEWQWWRASVISRDSSVRIMHTPRQQEMGRWYSPGHKSHRECLPSFPKLSQADVCSYPLQGPSLQRFFNNITSRHLLTPVSLTHLNLASFLPKLVVSLASMMSRCAAPLIWPALNWYRSDSFSTDADIIWVLVSLPLFCAS